VLGAIDGPHAPHADPADDPVTLTDDRADEGIGDRGAAAGTEGVLQLHLPGAASAGGHQRAASPLDDRAGDAAGRTTAIVSRCGSRKRRAARVTSAAVTRASAAGTWR